MARRLALYAFAVLLSVSLFAEGAENLLRNPSFTEGLAGWSVPGWFGETIGPEVDAEEFVEGGAALVLRGEEGKRGAVMQSVRRNPEVDRYRVAGWIKTEGFENRWTAEIVAESVYREGGRNRFAYARLLTPWGDADTEWTRFSRDFDVPEGTTQVRVFLSTRGPEGRSNTGTAWFDAVALSELVSETGTVAIRRFHPGGARGLFPIGEAPSLSFHLVNGFNEAKTFQVNFSVEDFGGRTVYRSPGETMEAGPLSIGEVALEADPPDKRGFYAVRLEIRENGDLLAEAESSFVVASPPEPPDPFFGLNQFTAGPPEAVRLMGAGSQGVTVSWSVERAQGEFHFDGLDARVDSLLGAGIRPVAMPFVAHAHYSHPRWVRQENRRLEEAGEDPYPEEYYRAYAGFLRKAAERYRGRMDIWILVQEIDLTMARDPAAAARYVRKVRAAIPAIKEGNPDAVVGGVGVSGVDGQQAPRFPRSRILWPELAGRLDGKFFNPYVDPRRWGPGRTPRGPEEGNFREILLEALALSREHGATRFGIGEKGFAIVSELPPSSPYAKDMARVLARDFVIAKSVPELEFYLFYKFGAGGGSGRFDYGMFKENRVPRPGVAAYAAVASLLAHADRPALVQLHQDIQVHTFRRGEGSVAAVWSVLDDPVALKVKDMPGPVEAYDLMGNLAERHGFEKGELELSLTQAPLFLLSPHPQEALAGALEQARFSLPLVKGALRFETLERLALELVNQTGEPIRVAAELSPPRGAVWEGGPQEATLPPGGRKALTFRLSEVDFARFNRQELKARVSMEAGGAVELAKFVNLVPVARRPHAGPVDADLARYATLDAIVLDSPDHLEPPDALSARMWTGPEDLSVRAWVSYDDDLFYFAAAVKDDVHVQEQVASRIWRQDGFQLGFNPLNDALPFEISGISGYGENDYEYGIALAPEGPVAYCWTAGKEGAQLRSSVVGFPLAIRRVGGEETHYELAIPWEGLAPLAPAPGRAFGFNFVRLDTDEPGTRAQYWMGLTPGIYSGKDPSAFKTFVLMP